MALFRILLVIVLAALSPAFAGTETPASTRLSIETASGSHAFTVDVMRTTAELERGLMFRRHMAADKGMLFDFRTPQQVSMWMKNTYLALDMLFIGEDGRVVTVKENAVPMSEDIISSGGPVTGVLEVNAGTAKRIGVHPGDLVRHAMFGS